ncbi:MAG: hypothetical protein ACP6IY_22380 [Promethearchaeia archaeon]
MAWQRELERLDTLIDTIREDSSLEEKKVLKMIEPINEHRRKLYLSMEKSIVYCQACWRINIDMIYNPLMRMWYCPDCYRELHEIYEKEPNPDYGQLFP